MITRSGWFLAGVSLLVTVIGGVFAYDELLVIGITGLFLVVLALLWVGIRPHLDVERTIEPDRVTVGETALGLVIVRNLGSRRSRGLTAEEHFGGQSLEIPIPRLDPGEEASTPYPLPTRRRGVITVGPMVVRRSDPFGLVATERDYGVLRTLYVHPKVHPILPLPSGVARDLEGPTSDTAPQGGMAFHTLREYVRGDDLRQIHWKSTARLGNLMVRHMVDSSHPVNTVLLDTREDHSTAVGFEQAVEAAASIVVACARQNFPIRFLTTGGVDVGGGRRPVAPTAMLDLLAAVERSPDEDLIESVKVLGTSSTGGSLIFVTGESSADDLPALSRIRRRFDQMVVLRFNDGVQLLEPTPGSRGAVPGAVTLDLTSSEAFVKMWSRMGRR